MTEFELVSAIRNIVTSHEGVTNFKPSIQQIRDEVDTLRIRLLTELDAQNRYFTMFDQYYQTIEVSTKYDAISKTTTAKIPVIHFRGNGLAAIRYIGGLSGGDSHKFITGKDSHWANSSPYTGHLAAVHYSGDGDLKFMSRNAPKKIMVEAVFVRPRDCKSYNGYDWEKDRYPVDYASFSRIHKQIFR
jgi:hypothetical protein